MDYVHGQTKLSKIADDARDLGLSPMFDHVFSGGADLRKYSDRKSSLKCSKVKHKQKSQCCWRTGSTVVVVINVRVIRPFARHHNETDVYITPQSARNLFPIVGLMVILFTTVDIWYVRNHIKSDEGDVLPHGRRRMFRDNAW